MDLEKLVLVRHALLTMYVESCDERDSGETDFDIIVDSVQLRVDADERFEGIDVNVQEISDRMAKQGAYRLLDRKIEQAIKSIANTV